MQLGLSRKERHIDLWHWFGQFQLSKVPPHQNLAESLTYNLSASGLHRLLPQLKMHTRPAELLALSTALAGEVAFFRSSSSSFFIGMLRKAPAMAQLGSEEQLLGKELGKPINIPELESASLPKTSLQPDELAAAYSGDSFQQHSLQSDELVAAYSPDSFQHQSLQADELVAACVRDSFQHQSLHADELAAAYSTESFQPQRLQQKELVRLKAFKPASSTRASQDQLDALKRRASQSLLRTTFLSIFILMVSSLTLPSLSLPSSFRSDSFPNCWALQLAEQDELLTTFGEQELENKDEFRRTCREKEIEKHNELQNLLWDQELEEFLTNKPFQLDQLQEYNQQQQQDQLEKNNDRSIQLQQNLSENEKNKKNEEKKKKLETTNEFHQSFENMILKKLVALLLEKHFASATSFQLNGNTAWKKYRETSKEIIFNKTMRDKKFPHQLRREQLDCKDLRSASFIALCPSNFADSSFQEDSLDSQSFQSTALTTELAQLQRRTLTPELAELEQPALYTEHAQLEATDLKKAASSLEFSTAQLCFREGSFSHLCGPKLLKAWPQGGVLSNQLPLSSSLTLTSLSFATCLAQACLLELHQKGSLSSQLSRVDLFGWIFLL